MLGRFCAYALVATKNAIMQTNDFTIFFIVFGIDYSKVRRIVFARGKPSTVWLDSS
jgi:hypothetical protein